MGQNKMRTDRTTVCSRPLLCALVRSDFYHLKDCAGVMVVLLALFIGIKDSCRAGQEVVHTFDPSTQAVEYL